MRKSSIWSGRVEKPSRSGKVFEVQEFLESGGGSDVHRMKNFIRDLDMGRQKKQTESLETFLSEVVKKKRGVV